MWVMWNVAFLPPYVVVVVCWCGRSKDGVGPFDEGAEPLLHPPDLREHLHKLCWTRVTEDKHRAQVSVFIST